ncbi:MAG: AEC family transporter [Deltaproteobacteria bacterium]
MSKLILSFAVILFGLLLGYGIQVLVNRKALALPLPIDQLRKLLQRTALLFLNPVAIVGALWVVNIESLRLAALPFTGLFAILVGGSLALAASKMLHLEPRKAGAMYGCGSFTNIGSIGALICFTFLGEQGFALVPIYKLFEELSYYSIGFPIAKYYSSTEKTERVMDRIKSLVKDPFILTALSSIVLGGLLNRSGFQRPEFYGIIVSVFVPLGTILLLTSIGLALKFRRVRDYLKECISVSVIKFLFVPVLSSSLAYVLGFGDFENGLPLKVVIILSSMPVAFNALIPPSIYDLDLDLANSCWFFTTSLLVLVLPLLLLIVNAF